MPHKDPEASEAYQKEYSSRPEVKERARVRSRAWHANNPERARENQQRQYYKDPGARVAATADWRKKNPEKYANQRLKYYGLTFVELKQYLDQQGWRCEICGVGLTMRTKHIDHCHATGAFRGVLCRDCNPALGMFKDRPDLLRKAAEYLEAIHGKA